jgi:hypothetical protein
MNDQVGGYFNLRNIVRRSFLIHDHQRIAAYLIEHND